MKADRFFNQRKVQNTLKAVQPYARKLVTLLKGFLLTATFGFIIYKLVFAYKLNVLLNETTFDINAGSFFHLFIVFVLMCINWLLETKKWQLLIAGNEQATFKDALKGVLSGVTLNIITPNQLGDFIGRIIYLKHTDKVKGTLSTMIGHTAQVMMTLAFGLYGLLYFFQYQGQINQQQYVWLNILLIIFIVMAVAGYFNIRIIARLKTPVRIRKYLDVFTQYNRKELLWLLSISLLRYLVFVVQYGLLVGIFQVDVAPEQAFICIVAAMCAQSFVPSFILVELGMRGASALWFFSAFTTQVAPVLLATYTLWIINVMLPGLLGMVFILKWRSVKE